MKNRLVYILVVFTMLNCKEATKQTLTENSKNEPKSIIVEPKKQLIFEVEIETSKPDDFMLLSNDLFLNNAQFMTIVVKQKLNPTETKKTMRFEFPENVIPDYNLGFSFGDKYEKEVKFIKANIVFDTIQLFITGDNVLEYFTLNDYVYYDDTNKLFKTKTVNGKHQPKLFLRRKFLDKISGFSE